MDNNIYSNILIINDLKEIIIKIENLILEKNNCVKNYDEKIQTLYNQYTNIHKNFIKHMSIT